MGGGASAAWPNPEPKVPWPMPTGTGRELGCVNTDGGSGGWLL